MTEFAYAVVITPRGVRTQTRSWRTAYASIWHNLQRIYHLVQLDLKQQAFGLSFGHFWLLLEPALQAGAYYFLLTVVFAMRGSDATFAFFFVAITFWRSHATLVGNAPHFLITKGYHYIEQGFGIKIAFLEFVTQEIVMFALRLIVLLVFLMIAGYTPSLMWVWALFIAICMFAFTLSLSVWLAIIGVVFKDSGKFVSHFVWLWWYLSPGLYSIKRIPEWAEPIFLLNPFSYIIPAIHSSLLEYSITFQQVTANTILALASSAFMWAGWKVLKRYGYIIAQYV